MLARLFRTFLVLVAVVVAVVAWRRWRARRLTAPAPVPHRWRELAHDEARLGEAISIYERIAALRARLRGVAPSLASEAYAVVEGMAELVDVRAELRGHLSTLGRAADPSSEAETRLAELRSRPARLDAEIEATICGLRQVYVDVLDGVSAPGGKMSQARSRLDDLRARVGAEAEVRRALGELRPDLPAE